MINLEEAGISIGFYAERLDLQCRRLRLAVSLTNKEKEAGQIEPRGIGLVHQAAADLRSLQKEAVVLGILINEAIVEDVPRLLRIPREFSKLLEANNRFISLSRQAGDLLQEHDHKDADKDEAPKESDLVAAVRALRERLGYEESKWTESTSNDQPEES